MWTDIRRVCGVPDVADDFYALLEVPPDATQEEIRDAFREKVRIYHPDHNDDPRANAQFTALKKAYDTLGDPVERNAYDRMGHLAYVGKRLDGLPDPDKWAPSEVDDGATVGNASRSGSGAAGRTSSGSTGGRSGGRTSPSASGSTGSASGRSTTGGRSGASGSGRRAASDGGATAARRSRPAHRSPIVSWIARHGLARRLVGWPLLWIAVAVYLAGLGAVASANAAAVGSLVDRLAGAEASVGGLGAALQRVAMPTFFEAAADPLLSGGTAEPVAVAGGALFVAGAVLLPAVVALLVYLTRMSPGWRPTYLYAVAALGPVLGFALGAALAPPLAAELALVLVLPALGLGVMVLSAFVRPRVEAVLFG